MNLSNPETTGVVVGGMITALACLGLLVLLLADTLALEIDMMNGGYALMLLAVFFAITGGVVTWVYAWRAGRLRRILGGEGRLAHWTYPARRYEQQQEKIYRREKSEKGGLFVITTILLVVIGGVVFVPAYISEDIRSPWVFLVYLGIIPQTGRKAPGIG
jgi:drug/metabolite transporter (DMT)-like permease